MLAGRLQQAGVAGDVAENLVGRYPPERISQALTAAKHRRPDDPPGWIVAALANDWDLSAFLARRHADDTRQERETADDPPAPRPAASSEPSVTGPRAGPLRCPRLDMRVIFGASWLPAPAQPYRDVRDAGVERAGIGGG